MSPVSNRDLNFNTADKMMNQNETFDVDQISEVGDEQANFQIKNLNFDHMGSIEILDSSTKNLPVNRILLVDD